MKVINQYISMSDKAVNGAGEIYIYGEIANEKWFDDDVTPKSILNALNEFENVNEVNIHINSYGGSCTAGNAIVAIMDNYRRKNNGVKFNSYIEGIAASMATGISAACDKVYMSDNSLYMIHKPWGMAIGNADELQKSIELLEKTEETLVNNYMRRFNGTEDELRQLLSDESWFTAEEAKSYGFVDEIISGVEIVASGNGVRIGNQKFQETVANKIKNKLPNIKLEKENKALNYNEELNQYGINKDMFDTLNIASEKVMEIVNAVKESVKTEPVEQFMDKQTAISELGCDDITAEQIVAFAKIGMNHKEDSEIKNKATAYDKIVKNAIDNAKTMAVKAQGENYNESLTDKFLNVLNYDEIVAQTEIWRKEAENSLNAGVRVSVQQNFNQIEKKENLDDYKI